jgi:rod shape-determining protein MreD
MIAERRIDSPERVPVARLLLLCVTVTVLHVAFLARLVVFQNRPETMLLLGIVGGVWLGAKSGAILGWMCGLSADIIGFGDLGAWALIVGLTAYIIGYSHDQAFSLTRERVPILLVAGATVVAQLSYLAVTGIVSDKPMPAPLSIGITLLVTVGLHVVLTIPLRWLVQHSVPLGSQR